MISSYVSPLSLYLTNSTAISVPSRLIITDVTNTKGLNPTPKNHPKSSYGYKLTKPWLDRDRYEIPKMKEINIQSRFDSSLKYLKPDRDK